MNVMLGHEVSSSYDHKTTMTSVGFPKNMSIAGGKFAGAVCTHGESHQVFIVNGVVDTSEKREQVVFDTNVCICGKFGFPPGR